MPDMLSGGCDYLAQHNGAVMAPLCGLVGGLLLALVVLGFTWLPAWLAAGSRGQRFGMGDTAEAASLASLWSLAHRPPRQTSLAPADGRNPDRGEARGALMLSGDLHQ